MLKRLLGITLTVASTILVAVAALPTQHAKPSRYLYLWSGTGTMKKMGLDMIAVIDVDPSSPNYAKVIDALTVDTMGMMPHHSEFDTPKSGGIFVNDFGSGSSYVINAKNPTRPSLLSRTGALPSARAPHSFARLSNGHVLSTVQFGDGKVAGNPGGLAEYDARGKFIRFSTSADAAFSGARIRTYALTTLPKINRILTTSSPMDSETTANVVQVWRLSDLKLLKTLAVPQGPDSTGKYPFEARTLPGGHAVLMNTYNCGFYTITNLDSDPKIERVMLMDHPKNIGCSVPIIAGKYMVMPIAYAHRYATLDISDPAHVHEVGSVEMDSTFFPHWIARDPLSDRVVVTDQGDGIPMVMLGRFDTATGKLTWDDRFKDAGATKPGVTFLNVSWPNGVKGKVVPHGALFVP